jgi:hypothetical protein
MIIDTDKQRIKCQHCCKMHELPSEGFAPNLEVAKLIEIKPNQILRGKLVNELEAISKSVRERVEQIQTDLLTGEVIIRDQCDEIRYETQLAIEEAHLELEKIHKRFMDEIDDYERKCCRNLIKINKNKRKIEKHLTEANLFNSKIESLLKQVQIESADIKAELFEARDILSKLEKVKDNLRSDIFSGVCLKFNKNTTGVKDSTIGFIKTQNSQLYFLENADRLKALDLTQKLYPNSNSIHDRPYTMIFPFSDSKILIIRDDRRENILISITDDKGEILNEKRLFNSFIEGIKVTPLVKDNFFFIGTRNRKSSFLVHSFDKNLRLIAKKVFDPSLYFLLSSNHHVFIGFYRENSNFISLECYNSNLELLKIFGQGNKDLPYYFPSSARRFLASKKYFILKSHFQYESEISVIKQKNGAIKYNFRVRIFDYWTLYLDKFLLLLSPECNMIFCYNFKGVLIDKLKLNLDLHKFKFTLNKELYFLDFKNNKIKLLKF